MTLHLTIAMRPFAKPRPRTATVDNRGHQLRRPRIYMAKSYRARQELCRLLVLKAYGEPISRPVFGMSQLRVDSVHSFKSKGPARFDKDNADGGWMDSLIGVLYVDDSQITRGDTIIERNTGEPDCIRLTVTELTKEAHND